MGPEETGRAARPRPARDPLAPDFGQHAAPAPVRTVDVHAGEHLLTVNPVDGSEIVLCPPTLRPEPPLHRGPEARAEADRAARPPVPAGPVQAAPPLLGRQEEREQLVRLIARGRSVRLTGPSGSGRTRLLDLVAEDCSDLAPDGVVRLTGHGRGAEELLHDLFHVVYDAPLLRPGPAELRALVRGIGAVVVVDDLEFGGGALDELLRATPECAFLFGATGETPLPSADSTVEEVTLGGLDRAGGVDLLERAVGRVLGEEEANWAGDLWFESEGLPLRFVQAGALLRQRDQLRHSADAVDEFGVFADPRPGGTRNSLTADPFGDDHGTEPDQDVPLPSLGEAAGPAPLLAARLSSSARATLRFAVALSGEVPHQAHLPALVGDTHADAALGELTACGLVTPVGPRYRLASGIQAQLEAAGYGDDTEVRAATAAAHYAWWAGHPSVTPERVCAEADAILAALAVVGPAALPPADGEQSTAVHLARTAVPAFAAGLHFGAWERALRAGAEASRLTGESADQAYFHHELGVLALLGGHLDRARAELETSIALRADLADKRGTLHGRRALALVSDRAGVAATTAAEEMSEARHEESAPPPVRYPDTLETQKHPVVPQPQTVPVQQHRRSLRGMARRNLVAAGAGALLVAVLGTVVGLGATSNKGSENSPSPSDITPSISTGIDDGRGSDGSGGLVGGSPGVGDPTSRTTSPATEGTPGASGEPSTGTSPGAPSASPTGGSGSSAGGGGTGTSPSPSPSKSSSSPSPTPSESPTTAPSEPTTPSTEPTTPEESPSTSTSASGPSSSSPSTADSGSPTI